MKKQIEINDNSANWVVVQKWINIKGYGICRRTLSCSASGARASFLRLPIGTKFDNWKTAYHDGYRCIKVKVIADAP